MGSVALPDPPVATFVSSEDEAGRYWYVVVAGQGEYQAGFESEARAAVLSELRRILSIPR